MYLLSEPVEMSGSYLRNELKVILNTHRWNSNGSIDVVCIHGVSQHGEVFGPLAERLARDDRSVMAVDLRGHGESLREPPWNTDTHVRDLADTFDAFDIERATVIGHSFGGRVAAAFAAVATDRIKQLVLLEPGLEIGAELALKSAEIERLDWSFATVEGAINALLSSDSMVAPSRDLVESYVRSDVGKGPDGRYRFRFCPSAAVVAWNEGVLPPPPIASVPTLFVQAETSLLDGSLQQRRYREALGDLVTIVSVRHGHNVLWEADEQTIQAIELFLAGPARA